MLVRRLSMPVGVGSSIFLTRAGSEKTLGHLRLVRFDVSDGRCEWEMRTHDGGIVLGNAFNEIQNPYLPPGCWIKPKIPLTMHLRVGAVLVPEFMFNVSGSVQLKVHERA